MRKARRWLANLILLCVSLIAITGILEVALRIHTPQDIRSFRRPLKHWTGQGCEPLFVHDSIRGARLAPNCTTTSTEPRNREYAITVHSNNHGFRDYKDYHLAKRERVRRVVVLGDSFTYGNGVEELARYSSLLDDLLGENIEVYNLALSNYGLDQALLTLGSEGLRYVPDVIIVGFSDPMLELYYPIDGHYNVKGHILVAEELCKFLQSRDIVTRDGRSSCDADASALHQSLREFRE